MVHRMSGLRFSVLRDPLKSNLDWAKEHTSVRCQHMFH